MAAAFEGGVASKESPDIPVRRYGTVPPPPEEESAWELEPARAGALRTIGDYGATAVFAAAAAAALLAGWLLYLR